MAIRLPLQGVFSKDIAGDTGNGSVAGMTVMGPFIIPQDTDNVTVKLQASVGAGVSAVFQTTDDGGTTWYDVARTSIVSNTGLAGGAQNAEWLNIPVVSPGVRTGVTFAGASIVSGGIGSSAASTLGQKQVSGLPIMSPTNRVGVIFTGNVAAGSSSLISVIVRANSQSATA